MAQRFDTAALALAGQPVAIAQQVGSTVAANSLLAFFSASTDVLAFRTGTSALSTPVWIDRSGRELTSISAEPLETPHHPQVSPDGRQLALIVGGDLWVYDVRGRPPIKLTFGGGAETPLWTRDGRRLVYETTGASVLAMSGSQKTEAITGSILAIPSDGSVSVPDLILAGGHFHPHAWSDNGRELLLTRFPAGAGGTGASADIVKFAIGAGTSPQAVVETPAFEGLTGVAMSPDGRWLAYTSNVTGRSEVWVRAYPGPGAPVRVSPAGGAYPVWARDGRELYYVEGTVLKAVPVESGTEFNFKPPVQLFNVAGRFMVTAQPPLYDVAPDGRFVFMRAPTTQTDAPMTIVLNWIEGLAD